MKAVIGLAPAVELNLTLLNEAYVDEALGSRIYQLRRVMLLFR